MNKIKDCHIIVCGPAVGKTYLATHDKRFVDLDGEKAKYKYGLENISSLENEKNKLNRGPVVNDDSSEYIIKLINKELKNNKYLLLSYHEKILKYVVDNKIPYCLVYPAKDLSYEYAKRMKKRGNSDLFIHSMTDIDIWNQFYAKDNNDNNARYKIELKSGQYLSDIINLFVD